MWTPTDVLFWLIMAICYVPALLILLALLVYLGKGAEWILNRLEEIF